MDYNFTTKPINCCQCICRRLNYVCARARTRMYVFPYTPYTPYTQRVCDYDYMAYCFRSTTSCTVYTEKKLKKRRKKTETNRKCENACHVLACVFVQPKKMISAQHHIEFNTNTLAPNRTRPRRDKDAETKGRDSEGKWESDSISSHKKNVYTFKRITLRHNSWQCM